MTILCAAALMTELALPAEALTSNDVVYYGNYKQSGTSPDFTVEPILWRVLEVSGDRALMLSEKIIDAGLPFHPVPEDKKKDVDYYIEHYYLTWWSESPIRLFLNGESVYEPSVSADKTEKVTNPKDYYFYDTAFSTGEGNAIIKDTVDNSVKYEYKVYDKDKPISNDNFPSGPDTEDKIFLLSYAEVDDGSETQSDKALGKKYGFNGRDSRIAQPTDYTKAQGVVKSSIESVHWWLRSPGRGVYWASSVLNGGSLINNYVNNETVDLRPAFRLNLKSLLFTSPAMGGKQTDVTDTLQEQKYDNDENVYEHTFSGRKFTTHKLTFATNTYKLASADVTSEKITTSADIKVELNYSGASTGDGYYLAAVVTSGDKALYYGRIKELKTEDKANGTAEFTIPKLNDGEEVYVFVEGKEEDDSSDRNKLTDFASLPICLNGEGREISIVESITISPLELTITEESNYQLKVTFAPEDVKEKEKEIEWSSDDESIATVDTNGLVSALKAGTTTIKATAKLSGKVARHTVTVIEKPLEPGLILTPMAMTISKGVNADISVTFKDIAEQPLTWKSSNENIATVDENGTVTAISEGKCEITVTTADGTDAICEVTVVQGSQTENQPQNNKGGGSSGCNAGIPGIVALLTLGSLIYIRSRNGK